MSDPGLDPPIEAGIFNTREKSSMDEETLVVYGCKLVVGE